NGWQTARLAGRQPGDPNHWSCHGRNPGRAQATEARVLDEPASRGYNDQKLSHEPGWRNW
ncbi:MAG: hypothetical protein J7M25_07415, partial [Deltaproteobacteria bacterium]|nr:hypothetical protein [Deltaproteobacteria bacterium]